MFTENEVNAVPVVLMLFWTCTRVGADGVVPVPARLAVCGLPVALSLTASVADLGPLAVGANVTLIAQVVPAATLVPQLLVWTKSPLFVPVIVMPLMDSAALPVLASVTV